MNWKNKKVLVTGADGFIGSHLTEELISKGAKVRAFVYYNAFNRWGWLDSFPREKKRKLDVFTGDVRDPHGVMTAVQGVDVVLHLAALIGIPYSYHSPDSYVDTNIKGTLNVLQAAKKYRVSKIVHTSTSEVYGTAQAVPMDESHPINPQSPYAATKSAADELAMSFYRSFNLPVAVLRPFNTFGPRQSARAVIPTIISQIYSGGKTVRLGNMSVSRDFNYVSNIVEAFIKVAETSETTGEILNAGSGIETPLQTLVDCIQEATGKKIKITLDYKRLRPEKSEVDRLVCDASKIKELCGWKEEVYLKEGLKKTCRWIKDNLGIYKPEMYNV